MTRALDRPTRWWLHTLRRRARQQQDDELDLSGPPPFPGEPERSAAIKFFNAAYRAEQSGLNQAHQLSHEVAAWDADLAEILRLYGEEEAWHRSLLEQFLAYLGGSVQPMGRVTRLLFEAHARARHMDTIVLSNLMFETIGSTTYRLALRRATHPEVRKMLTILTRDESFHVPLNVYFLKRILERSTGFDRTRLRLTHAALFVVLLLLPLFSRPKARAFDGIPTRQLVRSYATELAALFVDRPDVPLGTPWWLLRPLGIRPCDVAARGKTSAASAAAAADRRAALVD